MAKTTLKPLLKADGTLNHLGYTNHFNVHYNKQCAKGKLKEWDFYQILFDDKVLQLTIGHVSYAAQVNATLIDIATGEKRTVGKFMPCSRRFKRNMPLNPERAGTLRFFSKRLRAQFEVTDKYRRLSLTATDKVGVVAEIDVMLTNCSFVKDKMVIATPFEKPTQWYLNYKENCFVANGTCRIEDKSYNIANGFGLLDWGRGVWPFSHEWIWGNGGTVVDGKHFGFNIGWGFGDTSAATENVFFWDNKAHKLGAITQKNKKGKVVYKDNDERFVFEVQPIFDNFSKTKVLWVNNQCHQVFGKWQGHVVLDDGTVQKIPPFVAFCEHAVNNW